MSAPSGGDQRTHVDGSRPSQAWTEPSTAPAAPSSRQQPSKRLMSTVRWQASTCDNAAWSVDGTAAPLPADTRTNELRLANPACSVKIRQHLHILIHPEPIAAPRLNRARERSASLARPGRYLGEGVGGWSPIRSSGKLSLRLDVEPNKSSCGGGGPGRRVGVHDRPSGRPYLSSMNAGGSHWPGAPSGPKPRYGSRCRTVHECSHRRRGHLCALASSPEQILPASTLTGRSAQ